jgi:hypothetical protein
MRRRYARAAIGVPVGFTQDRASGLPHEHSLRRRIPAAIHTESVADKDADGLPGRIPERRMVALPARLKFLA